MRAQDLHSVLPPPRGRMWGSREHPELPSAPLSRLLPQTQAHVRHLPMLGWWEGSGAEGRPQLGGSRSEEGT